MTNNNYFVNSVRESTGLRLALLFGTLVISLIICGFIMQAISETINPESKNYFLLTSAIQSILVFILPACLTAKFASSNSKRWLDLYRGLSLKNVIGIILVFILFLPAMNWLISWNESLHLPESMSAIEQTFRNWEDSAGATTEILLKSSGFGSIIIGILVIGVLTGFAEEVFFRGALQKIFAQSSIGKHLAIWMAAIIFSAFHFQFFGFFPRMIMGVFFGYLVFWSSNLWVPIFAHALNNSLVVISSSLYDASSNPSFLDTIGKNDSGFPISAFLSVLATIIYIWLFRNYFFFKR